MKVFKLALVFLGLWSSLVFAHTSQEAYQTGPQGELWTGKGLVIKNAYVQPSISGQDSTAAYMTIENHSNMDYVLVGGYSPIAEHAVLHTTEMVDGVMKMRPVNKVRLHPGAKIVLRPGHMHLMMTDLRSNVYEGMRVPVCLKFDLVAPALCTDARVK